MTRHDVCGKEHSVFLAVNHHISERADPARRPKETRIHPELSKKLTPSSPCICNMSHTHILVSFCSNWWSWNSTRRYKIRVQPLSRLADYGLHPWRDEIIRRINRPGKMYKEPMWTATLHCLQTKQSNKNKQIIASYCDAVFHSRSWLGMLSKPKVNKKRGGTWRRSPDLWHVANSNEEFLKGGTGMKNIITVRCVPENVIDLTPEPKSKRLPEYGSGNLSCTVNSKH